MVEHFKTAVQNTLLTTTHENANFDPYAEATTIIKAVEDPPSDRITGLPGWSQTPSSPQSSNSSPDISKAPYLHKQLPSSSSSAGILGAFSHGEDSENTYLNTNRHAGWKKETTVQFHQIQRMMEALDALKVQHYLFFLFYDPYFPSFIFLMESYLLLTLTVHTSILHYTSSCPYTM